MEYILSVPGIDILYKIEDSSENILKIMDSQNFKPPGPIYKGPEYIDEWEF